MERKFALSSLILNPQTIPQRTKTKSKQRKKAKQIRSYEYEFSEDSVSSCWGLSLTEYFAKRSVARRVSFDCVRVEKLINQGLINPIRITKIR